MTELRLTELVGAGAEGGGDSEASAAVWAPRAVEHLVRLSSYPPELGLGAVCACAVGRDPGACASVCVCMRPCVCVRVMHTHMHTY